MEFYHVKSGNWQVLKVPQIDIGHHNLMPSPSNIILVQNEAESSKDLFHDFFTKKIEIVVKGGSRRLYHPMNKENCVSET